MNEFITTGRTDIAPHFPCKNGTCGNIDTDHIAKVR